MPAQDMFWGDRYGVVTDPFGHHWSFATHLKDLTPAELQAAMSEAFAQHS
jgi:PhnB protein